MNLNLLLIVYETLQLLWSEKTNKIMFQLLNYKLSSSIVTHVQILCYNLFWKWKYFSKLWIEKFYLVFICKLKNFPV